MSAGTVRGADAREFVKAFNSICQWNGNWERWNDMVHLFAIEIANSVDLNHKDERNKDYIRIAEKYKQEEFRKFADLLCLMVEALERNPFQDFLGQMYMELDMGSKAHGQCFTPFSVCQMMAGMSLPEEEVKAKIEQRGWISLNDCACGAGATLIAAAERLQQIGVNYQQSALFVAQDLDSTVAMMCYIQLSLIGCAGRVRIGDTLLNPDNTDLLLGDGKPTTWYFPMLYSDIWAGRIFARRMDMILGAAQRAIPELGQPGMSENPPEEPKALDGPKAAQAAPKAEQEVPKPYQEPEIISGFGLKTVQKARGRMSEGQLMFDLTGV